jgi:hypothetical protein
MTPEKSTGEEPRHSVTALFDSREEVDKAIADLTQAGFAERHLSVAEGAEAMVMAKPPREEGLLTTLLNIFVFMPKDDRSSVEEALRRGAFALTVRARPDDYEHAIDILDRDGAIDLDERQLVWARDAAPLPTAEPEWLPTASPVFAEHEIHDPLVNPAASADVRERIGVGTAGMMAGIDPARPQAEPGAPNESVEERQAAREQSRSRRRRRVLTHVEPAQTVVADPLDPSDRA